MEHDETTPLPVPAEITLMLDRYEDIFSSFDARPYSERALSVDFLEEIRRASADKTDEGVDLVLLMPKDKRDERHEATIKERLAAHFKKHHRQLVKDKQGINRLGLQMIVFGTIFMIAAALILHKNTSESLVFSFLVVFLEPAAWFLLWEGMDQIVFKAKEMNKELDFYHKMSNAHNHVHFKNLVP